MSEITKEHFDTAIGALTGKLDTFITDQKEANRNHRKDKIELFNRVGSNESDIKTIKETRPTLAQVIKASATIGFLVIGVLQLIIYFASNNG